MMTAYILILFAHVGVLGSGNSNALSMQEFSSEQTCKTAGEAAKRMADNSVKVIHFQCVKK